MNMFATLVEISVLLAFCEACQYKHQTCTQYAALGDGFTVNFGRLDGHCRPKAQTITRATIQVNKTKIDLPFSKTTFWATFTPKNASSGSHRHALTYSYHCKHRSTANVSHLQQNIHLHLLIADFSLVKNIDQPFEGENVELLSSSGLTTNIEVKFTFSPVGKGKERVAICPLNMKKSKRRGNWVISRSNNNCQLLITNVTSADSGNYEAVGMLPSGDADGKHHRFAYSNLVPLRVEAPTFGPASENFKSKIYIVVAALSVTLVLIVFAVAVIVFGVNRYRCGYARVQDPPAPVPHQPPEQPVGYGSMDVPPPVAAPGRALNPPIPDGAQGATSHDPPGGVNPGHITPNPRDTPSCISPPPLVSIRSSPPVVGVAASAVFGPVVSSEHSGGGNHQAEKSSDRASGLKLYTTEQGSQVTLSFTSDPVGLLVGSSPAAVATDPDVPVAPSPLATIVEPQSLPASGVPSETSSKSDGSNSPVNSDHSSGCE